MWTAAAAAENPPAAKEPVVKEWKVEWGGRPRDPYVASFDPGTESFRRYEIEDDTNPHTVIVDPDGFVWYAGNRNGRLDMRTGEYRLATPHATPDSRSRRIEVTADGSIWYGDEPRGYLGRIDPATGKAKEYAMPGGATSKPYALTQDGDGRLWLSQTGPDKKLVVFDPKSERFVAVHDVSETIRHMMYDPKTGAMWFGTDANQIGRVLTRAAP